MKLVVLLCFIVGVTGIVVAQTAHPTTKYGEVQIGSDLTTPVAKQEKLPVEDTVSSKAVASICSPEIDKNCLAFGTMLPQPPDITWTQSVKDGVYTATLNDPTNHWRCYVISHYGYPMTAFTVTCVDTTSTGVTEPSKGK